jgi:hypothetical protein
MVTFYPPAVQKIAQPNAVHEMQAKLRRYYRDAGVSAVAAEMDKVAREIAEFYRPEETREQFVRQLERRAA